MTYVCLLVNWFVCLCCLLPFLKKRKSDFHAIWHRCSASVPKFNVNFSEVKVKVEGQNRHTESLPLVIAWL